MLTFKKWETHCVEMVGSGKLLGSLPSIIYHLSIRRKKGGLFPPKKKQLTAGTPEEMEVWMICMDAPASKRFTYMIFQ